MSQRASYPEMVPVLQEGGVRLRAHAEADLPGIVEQCRDPQTVRWTSVPEGYDEEDARSFLARVREDWERGAATSPRWWAVEAVDEDGTWRFAGSYDYRPDGRGAAEVGFGLHPWARGRGVGEAALRLLLDHAFTEDGVQTMRWTVERGNWASRRLAWSCGFRLHGTVRARVPDREGGPPREAWVGSLRHDEPREPGARWLEPPVLHGERVVLRPWREDDADHLVLDELAHRFVGPALPTDAESGYAAWLLRHREAMASGQSVDWCLADPETDRPWGWLGVFGLGEKFAYGSGTVGYWTVPDARGKGVVTEALGLVAGHAFAPAPDDVRDPAGGLGLHRLAAQTDWRNAASQAALVRAGWRWCGTEQDACVYEPGGPGFDSARFELLAEPADRPGLAHTLPAPPRLVADQVTLRPFTAADLPLVAGMLQEEDFGPGHEPDAGYAEAETWWSAVRHAQWAGARHTWAVCATDAMTGLEEPIGWFAADLPPDGDGPIGVSFWIAPEHRGQGFSHEALEAAFGHLGGEDNGAAREVRAEVDAENGAALTVLRRTGFTEWARARQADGRTTVHLRIVPGADRVADAVADVVRAVEVPVLEGTGVRLRPWRHSDAPRIAEACSDPVSQQYLADLPRDYTEQDARTFVAMAHDEAREGRSLPWCLADPETDECLGALSIMELPAHLAATGRRTSGVIGYWLHPDARGRGVLTEALRMAVRHAFVDTADGGLGLDRLALRAAASNHASQAAAGRAGFREVGRDRRAERLGDNTFDDLVRFDLLAEEWRSQAPAAVEQPAG